jgi:hypothetical protein
MTRKYDYIRQLFSEYGQRTDAVFAYPNDAKRTLRKLVREAVQAALDEYMPAEPAEVQKQQGREIARRLVP